MNGLLGNKKYMVYTLISQPKMLYSIYQYTISLRPIRKQFSRVRSPTRGLTLSDRAEIPIQACLVLGTHVRFLTIAAPFLPNVPSVRIKAFQSPFREQVLGQPCK